MRLGLVLIQRMDGTALTGRRNKMKKTAWCLLLCVITGLNGARADEAVELRRRDALHTHDGVVEQPETDFEAFLKQGLQSLEWGLLMEAEGYYAESGGDDESDLTLATVQFLLHAAVNDWIHGHLGLLWEEDDTESDNLDEGYIELGGTEDYPYYLIAGRFYLPFGNFKSAFISDPLTLELAEINQSSAMVGYDFEWIDVNVGAFKGDVEEGEEEDDTVSDFYASITCSPAECFECGIYWLSDLLETETQAEFGSDAAQLNGYDKQGGAGAFANVYIGAFMFNAEFVSALDSYDIAGGSYMPMAFNLEASMQVSDKWLTGLTFQGSDDLYADFEGGAFHVHADSLMHAMVLQGANELKSGSVADMGEPGIPVTPEVPLADLAFLGAVEDGTPLLELANPVR